MGSCQKKFWGKFLQSLWTTQNNTRKTNLPMTASLHTRLDYTTTHLGKKKLSENSKDATSQQWEKKWGT
jgi:hypothetical protein